MIRLAAPIRLAFSFVLASILGVAGTLAHGFWSAWWLSLFSVAGLLTLILLLPRSQQSQRQAALLTLLWGLSYFGIGVGWLYISMHRFGGLPMALAAAGVLAMAALLASFGALAAFVAVKWAKTLTGRGLVLAALWALAEWTRGWIFTGFPWLAQGYAQLDGPLQWLAPWIGVFGITLIVNLLSLCLGLACAAMVTGKWKAALPALSAAAIAALALLGAEKLHIRFTDSLPGPISVRLVQGNVAQEMKFDPQKARQAMQRYTATIAASKAQLTVLPETAWVLPWLQTPADLMGDLRSALATSNTTLALGIPAIESANFYNSVAVISPNGELHSRYDKQHLVPFGEFIPPGFRWFVNLMRIPLGDFTRGAQQQPLFEIAGQSIGFNICYEDLFGEALAVQVRQGAGILVNVSNIAWFGDSHALPQHLMIARMRSLELGRPMLRATNTGVTAYIDADGQVIAQLKNNIDSALDVHVVGRTGLTPFARWGHSIMLILSACVLALGLALKSR